ncbi:homeobox protein dve-1 isoform X1 [Vespula maculifrons]|uniref:Homeobox protein dve-1 isoform X1 n=1 Tax=Vespula maculifrons TaxID=7453 RepID=A0ABD2CAN4_VESMC
MDFQSAMDTFVEAWMAANTKNDQVQSQALALTHKTSPPSRPSSVSSLPRSPQSHQSQQSQQQSTPQPPPSTHLSQSQTPLGASSHQTPFSAHNQHPKQEIAASPKQEGFDLSKSASSTARIKSPFRGQDRVKISSRQVCEIYLGLSYLYHKDTKENNILEIMNRIIENQSDIFFMIFGCINSS